MSEYLITYTYEIHETGIQSKDLKNAVDNFYNGDLFSQDKGQPVIISIEEKDLPTGNFVPALGWYDGLPEGAE